ncbi:MAG: hypothetical protein R3B57_08095 [Phycisphaerales bacterium]
MPATGKICVICGQDCSDRPRTKDKDGRYACRDCLAKQQKSARPDASSTPRQPKAKPTPTGVDPVLAGLIDDAPAMHACPGCSRLIRADAKICLHCGFNTQTGRAVRTRVTNPTAAPKKQVSLGPLFSAKVIIGVGLLAFAGLAALTIAVPPLGLGLYILALIFLGLPIAACYIILPVVDGTPSRAFVNLFGISGLIWCYTINHREWLRALNTVYLLGFAIGVALFFGLGSTFESDLETTNANQTNRYAATPSRTPDDANDSEAITSNTFDDTPAPNWQDAYASQIARDAARDGEHPAAVERALYSIADRRVRWRASNTDDEGVRADAQAILASAKSIEDFPEPDIRYAVTRFDRMPEEDRADLLALVTSPDWSGPTATDSDLSDDPENADATDDPPADEGP